MVKVVAVMVAHVDMTMAEAAVECAKIQVQQTFNERFGGACALGAAPDGETTFHSLIMHAERGVMETMGRMAGGDYSAKRWVENEKGEKKEF